MKIDQINKVINTEQTRSTDRVGTERTGKTGRLTKAQSSRSSSSTDRVYISDQAEELSNLISRVMSLPDVRADRVESLRSAATSVANQPTASEIADSILRDESHAAA